MHRNEQLLRRGYEAFARGDLETLADVIAEDTVWHFGGRSPMSGAYRNRDELFGFFARTVELTDRFEVEVLDVLANDGGAVALTVSRADAAGSRLEAKGVAVYEVRDGKVAAARHYIDDQYASDEFWTDAARAAEARNRRSLDEPAETRTFPRGRLDLVTIAGATLGRGTFEPGWRWSESVKQAAGTDSCMVAHAGYALSGCMRIHMDDGTEFDIRPGDAFVIAPGHDAWVLGDEPCVLLDFQGASNYAQADVRT